MRGSQKKKGVLKPNHGYLQWISFCARSPDLSSFYPDPKPAYISVQELSKHNKINDCWMALSGDVYNVTPYLDYHPGGISALMEGVGKDASKLFYETHSYVNFRKILAKCYISPLKSISLNLMDEDKALIPSTNKFLSTLSISSTNLKSASFSHNPMENIKNYDALINQTSQKFIEFMGVEKCRRKYHITPRMDTVAIKIKSIKFGIKIQKGFSAKFDGRILYFLSYFNDVRYIIHLEFTKKTKNYCKVKWLNMDIGILEIDVFYQMEFEEDLLSIATQTDDSSNRSYILNNKNGGTLPLTCNPLLNNDRTYDVQEFLSHIQYHESKLVEKREICPEVYFFRFELPPQVSMKCPLGYHNMIRLCPSEDDMGKPYTPVPSHLVLPQGSVYSPTTDIIPSYNNTLNFIIKIYSDGLFTQKLHKHFPKGSHVWISDFIGDFDESKLFTTSNLNAIPSNNESQNSNNHLLPTINITKSIVNITTDSDLNSLLLISAGTGITPILGILHRLYNDEKYFNALDNVSPTSPQHQRTSMSPSRRASITNRRESNAFNFSKWLFEKILLVDCNRTPSDIIRKKELDNLRLNWLQKFNFINVISRPPKNYSLPNIDFITGHLNEEIMLSHVLPQFWGQPNSPPPSKEFITQGFYEPEKLHTAFTCICGSTSFNNSILNLLKSLGFNENKIFIFSE